MIDALFLFAIGILVLIAIYFTLHRFSPDALISKLVDIALFIAALWLCWHFLVPLIK